LKIQWRQKTLGGGHLPNARKRHSTFFSGTTMSDACTKQVIGRTRVELSVDMLAYVIGSLVGV
jgi:hypothetical protein